MQPPVQLLVSLGLACCVALLGWSLARAPEEIRVFTFGLMPPIQFFVGSIRFVGWFRFASTGFTTFFSIVRLAQLSYWARTFILGRIRL